LRPFPEVPVSTVSATEARRCLYSMIDEVGQSHQPVQIHGKRGNAVLLSEDDWRSIQETFHLLAIPGMRESILEGMATEASALTPEPGWSAGPFSLETGPEACPQTRLRVACSKAEGPGPTKP
jgi:antitoxin YefM